MAPALFPRRQLNPALSKRQGGGMSMVSTLKSLRALSDPTRLRIVALLEKDELSVNELKEITRMGQSRISTHLGLLQDSALVQSRREGKRTFYRLNQHADAVAGEFIQLAIRGAEDAAALAETVPIEQGQTTIPAARAEPDAGRAPRSLSSNTVTLCQSPPVALRSAGSPSMPHSSSSSRHPWAETSSHVGTWCVASTSSSRRP